MIKLGNLTNSPVKEQVEGGLQEVGADGRQKQPEGDCDVIQEKW